MRIDCPIATESAGNENNIINRGIQFSFKFFDYTYFIHVTFYYHDH